METIENKTTNSQLEISFENEYIWIQQNEYDGDVWATIGTVMIDPKDGKKVIAALQAALKEAEK